MKAGGHRGPGGGLWPTKTPPGTRENVPACSGPGRQPFKWGPWLGTAVAVPGCRRAQLGCHLERIADSPWVPACTAWMSNLTVTIYIYIYIYVYVTNLVAGWGTQFPTDLLQDPLLSSV